MGNSGIEPDEGGEWSSPGTELKRTSICVEPITKLSEEDDEAGELDKAEGALGVELPAAEYAALPLYPGKGKRRHSTLGCMRRIDFEIK